MILKFGLKSLLRKNLIPNTGIMDLRIMPMPILNDTLMGREVVVAVTEGSLDFGPWEQIFYGEFDGKRRKRVLVKIIGE